MVREDTREKIKRLLECEQIRFLLSSFYGNHGDPDDAVGGSILKVIEGPGELVEKKILFSLLENVSPKMLAKDLMADRSVIRSLEELQKEKILKTFEPNKKVIAVYFPDSAYREQVGDILNKLRKINYNAITFVGTLCNDKHEKEEYVYYGGHGIIEQMDFVDLFICATYAHDLPKTAKKFTSCMISTIARFQKKRMF